MNRREFTASLAAFAAAPTLPIALPAAAATPAALPPGAYLWAELIARAQNACSPSMLANHLSISTTASQQLFNQLLRDGVIKAPSLAGVAQAAKPLQTAGAEHTIVGKAAKKVTDWPKNDASAPLANTEQAGLGCDDAENLEDDADASPTKPPEESPQSG